MTHAISTHLFANHRLTVRRRSSAYKHAGIGKPSRSFALRSTWTTNNAPKLMELKHWFADSELKLHSLPFADVYRRCSGERAARTP